MKIELYLYDEFDKSAYKILKLLDDNKIEFTVQTYKKDDDLSAILGERVKRLPFVKIDDNRVGGYYDLFEYLVSSGIINYEGKSCPK